jgi:hypothetical protein
VILVICLIFFGLLQVAQLYAAQAVLTYSAAAGARARAVGFNRFMTHKVVHVAAIPVAGALLNPQVARGGGAATFWGSASPDEAWGAAFRLGEPHSPQYDIERSRIPLFLGTRWWNEMYPVLEYERWPDLHWDDTTAGDVFVRVRARQDVPLVFPFARTFYAGDRVTIHSGEADEHHYLTREAHARLYLE